MIHNTSEYDLKSVTCVYYIRVYVNRNIMMVVWPTTYQYLTTIAQSVFHHSMDVRRFVHMIADVNRKCTQVYITRLSVSVLRTLCVAFTQCCHLHAVCWRLIIYRVLLIQSASYVPKGSMRRAGWRIRYKPSLTRLVKVQCSSWHIMDHFGVIWVNNKCLVTFLQVIYFVFVFNIFIEILRSAWHRGVMKG